MRPEADLIAYVDANLERLQQFLPANAKLVIYVPIGLDGTFGIPRGAEPLNDLKPQLAEIPADRFPVVFFTRDQSELRYAIIQAPKARE